MAFRDESEALRERVRRLEGLAQSTEDELRRLDARMSEVEAQRSKSWFPWSPDQLAGGSSQTKAGREDRPGLALRIASVVVAVVLVGYAIYVLGDVIYQLVVQWVVP